MKKALLLTLTALLILYACPCLGEEITLSFIGDCSLGETYQSRNSATSFTATLNQHGMDWPFSLVRDILDADDFTFANLEVALTARTRHVEKAHPLSGPPQNAQALLYSGVDAVNTVNNHCLDFYPEGYLDTLAALDGLAFPHFGTIRRKDLGDQGDQALLREVKGVTIGAVGFSYPMEYNVKLIGNSVRRLKEAGCDLVVVSLHWGLETHPVPEYWQYDFARELIDQGADVVWGHHPHVLQPIQVYNGGVILYSTGNFTFGSMSPTVDRDTGIFQLTYETAEGGPVLRQLRVIPCVTTGAGDYRPYALTAPEDRLRVFKKLISRKEKKGLQNLPASFLETGVVQIRDGQIVE